MNHTKMNRTTKTSKPDLSHIRKNNRFLRMAALFGVLHIISAVPILAMGLLPMTTLAFVLSGLLNLIFYCGFMAGFVVLSRRHNAPHLGMASWAMIAATTFLTIIELFFGPLQRSLGIATLQNLLFGITLFSGGLAIWFGYGLWTTRTILGWLASTAAILNIVIGASLLSVVFSGIGGALLLPAVIIEVVILLKSSEFTPSRSKAHAQK